MSHKHNLQSSRNKAFQNLHNLVEWVFSGLLHAFEGVMQGVKLVRATYCLKK